MAVGTTADKPDLVLEHRKRTKLVEAAEGRRAGMVERMHGWYDHSVDLEEEDNADFGSWTGFDIGFAKGTGARHDPAVADVTHLRKARN